MGILGLAFRIMWLDDVGCWVCLCGFFLNLALGPFPRLIFALMAVPLIVLGWWLCSTIRPHWDVGLGPLELCKVWGGHKWPFAESAGKEVSLKMARVRRKSFSKNRRKNNNNLCSIFV